MNAYTSPQNERIRFYSESPPTTQFKKYKLNYEQKNKRTKSKSPPTMHQITCMSLLMADWGRDWNEKTEEYGRHVSSPQKRGYRKHVSDFTPNPSNFSCPVSITNYPNKFIVVTKSYIIYFLRPSGSNPLERNMKVPIPEPPTKSLEGDREFTIVGKIKPELPHIFEWTDLPAACGGRDRITR